MAGGDCTGDGGPTKADDRERTRFSSPTRLDCTHRRTLRKAADEPIPLRRIARAVRASGARRPAAQGAGRLRDRKGRRAAAREVSGGDGLRRQRPALRHGNGRADLARGGGRAEAAPPDRATRRHRRRREVRQSHHLCRRPAVPRRDHGPERQRLLRVPAEDLEIHRHRRRREVRQTRSLVRRQDTDRLRQRHARPVPRAGRLHLLDEGRLREAGDDARQRQEVHHARLARLSRQAGRRRPRSDDDRRHGQPRRPRVHVVRRPDREQHLSATSRRRQARRPHPRRPRRRLGQGPRPDPRASVDLAADDADHDAHGPGRPGGDQSLRFGRLRRRLSRQPLLFAVQPSQDQPARHGAEGIDVRNEGQRFRLERRPGFPPDGRARSAEWITTRDRHRRMVQALLPEFAAREGGGVRRDLSRPKSGRRSLVRQAATS